ncbi:MAG: WG repeat-containing protein [Bernardetiaceae bacterium]|nr:WG repeat-containing protein [Bernardetiaceae bacterium]
MSIMRFILTFCLMLCLSLEGVRAQNNLLLEVWDSPKKGVINGEGKTILPTVHEEVFLTENLPYIVVREQGKYGLYDDKGNKILPTELQQIKLLDSQNIAYQKEEKWTLRHKNGNTYEADAFENLPATFVRFSKNNKFGILAPEAKIVLEAKYDSVAVFIDTKQKPLFIAKSSNGFQIFDAKGEPLQKEFYSQTSPLHSDFLKLKTSNGKYGLASPEKGLLLEAQYDEISPIRTPYLIIKKNNEDLALYDPTQAKFLSEAKYKRFGVFSNGYIALCNLEKCDLVSTGGKKILSESYDDFHEIATGLLAFRKNGLWGLLKADKILTQPTYRLIFDMPQTQSITKVLSQDYKEGIIDSEGKLLLEPLYNLVEVYDKFIIGYEGSYYSVMFSDGKGGWLPKEHYGLLSEAGIDAQRLYGEQQFEISMNTQARFFQWIEEGETWKLVDRKGKSPFPTNFDKIIADPLANLSIAKNFKNERRKASEVYLINQNQGQLLFKLPINWFELADFRTANIARAATDSMPYNAIVHRNGKLIKQFEVGGSLKNIDTLYSFFEMRMLVKAGGLYGFLDEEGNIIADFQYDYAEDFNSQGVACVGKNGKFGIIDKNGKLLADLQFDAPLMRFIKGYAVTKKEGKNGLIDAKGKLIIPNEYDWIAPPSDDFVRAVKNRKMGLLDLKNKVILDFKYDYVAAPKNGFVTIRENKKFGFANTEGKILLAPNLDIEYVSTLEHGIAFTGDGRIKDATPSPTPAFYRQGYIDAKGKTLVPTQYSYIHNFPEIYKKQKGVTHVVKNDKNGYINHEGKEVVPPIYDEIDANFEENYLRKRGVSAVSKNGLQGYIDAKGKEFLPCEYTEIKGFEAIYTKPEALAVAKKGDKFGCIDTHGAVAIPFEYDFIGIDERLPNLAFVRKADQWGVRNHLNEEIIATDFAQTKLLYDSSSQKAIIEVKSKEKLFTYWNANGQAVAALTGEEAKNWAQDLAAVRHSNKKWGFKNAQNEWKIPAQYENVGNFSDGLAFVKTNNGKYGFMDKNQNIKIAAEYEAATDFNEGRAFVKQNDKWILINTEGNPIGKNQFDQVYKFNQGLAVVGEKSKDMMLYALLDKEGKLLTKFEYSEIGKMSEGRIAVRYYHKNDEKHRFGYLNQQGAKVVDFIYEVAQPFHEGIARVKPSAKGKWTFIDTEGKELIRAYFREASDYSEGIIAGDGGMLIDAQRNSKGRLEGQNPIPLFAFSNGTIATQTDEGAVHFDKQGKRLYAEYYDSLLSFNSERALAKSGEIWQLNRKVGNEGKVSDVTVMFTLPKKTAYLKKYGRGHKFKTETGIYVADQNFVKKREGQWFWIDKKGTKVHPQLFEWVNLEDNGLYKTCTSGVYGFAQTDGKWIAEPRYALRKYGKNFIIHLRNGDHRSYLKIDGEWIYK